MSVSLATVAQDVRANKGVIVAATHGFTKAAANLADARGIDLLALVDAENKVWAEYFGNEPIRAGGVLARFGLSKQSVRLIHGDEPGCGDPLSDAR